MTVSVRQLHPLFVGEVTGVDASQPLDQATQEALQAAIDRYAVLILHGQKLNDGMQIAFAANFGGISMPRYSYAAQHRIDPRLADISNLDAHGAVRNRTHHRRLAARAVMPDKERRLASATAEPQMIANWTRP